MHTLYTHVFKDLNIKYFDGHYFCFQSSTLVNQDGEDFNWTLEFSNIVYCSAAQEQLSNTAAALPLTQEESEV